MNWKSTPFAMPVFLGMIVRPHVLESFDLVGLGLRFSELASFKFFNSECRDNARVYCIEMNVSFVAYLLHFVETRDLTRLGISQIIYIYMYKIWMEW